MNAAFAQDRLNQHASHLVRVDLLHQQVVQVVQDLGVVERPWLLAERRAKTVRVGRHDEAGHILRAAR
ncbi:hypothetical protein D9M68_805100 [compost metagenome]